MLLFFSIIYLRLLLDETIQKHHPCLFLNIVKIIKLLFSIFNLINLYKSNVK